MQFFKNVLSTVVGLFLFCFLFFIIIIIIGVMAAAGSSSSNDVVKVEDNSVIELDLEDVTDDYSGSFKYTDFSLLDHTYNEGLVDVLRALDHAKTDSRIKGITLTNSNASLGMAQSKALRDKLEEVKKAGKFVVAYSDAYSQRDYYLNSVADTLYLNPAGELEFKGLSSEVLFFKDFQDKTGVKMEVIRHGKYKSAVEPFLSNEMSEANRQQITELLNSVWASVAEDISKSRKIPVATLNNIADSLGARTPERAKAVKLIDKIGYQDEYENGIKKALSLRKTEEFNTVDVLDYVKATLGEVQANTFTNDIVAIIYAQGDINGGEGDVNVIGEESIRRAFKEALADDGVKAIVLRVDSPGGSALTSELIWREVELAKKRKPVVVSMGNYAASGGYYISCGADRIFAEPNTITGSIGVFGALPNLTGLANKVGIHAEEVSTHANATGYSVFTPLKESTRGYITEDIEDVYQTFVSRVAAGRKMSPEAVDAIAQGRVWSGSEALKVGLVDELGGLDKAVAHAAKLAKSKKYGTLDYPVYEKEFGDMFKGLGFAKTKEELIKEEVGAEAYEVMQRIKRISQLKGAQAAMPYEINIR
ncbi:protease IV [Flavobacterium akiainvivens]|uniref:Protease IV n=1 Tax=Flavobacterium akiainvivens TaxID=1202724 RepID=A0A0M8MBF3_9FLAO|nr:signal peptide peptidase SppA [Flavobacterium akiainvivens]KOS06595.1 protease IV [Flavobacterium akiainvivens]SFQ09607.1 protease-4 [Flavobacterium akiainvivens]